MADEAWTDARVEDLPVVLEISAEVWPDVLARLETGVFLDSATGDRFSIAADIWPDNLALVQFGTSMARRARVTISVEYGVEQSVIA